jgi:SAM-dependent methyltransferase
MNYYLPQNYTSRSIPEYFDDTAIYKDEKIHQPHIYYLAQYLVTKFNTSTVMDIGSGNGEKLSYLQVRNKIGVDFGSNLEFCRTEYPKNKWVELNLEQEEQTREFQLPTERCIIICSDVVEHLVNPLHLLKLLQRACEKGHIVITSTPDRIKLRGVQHVGPPNNKSHIREWSIDEYRCLLDKYLSPPLFIGHSINNTIVRKYSTIISIHDNYEKKDKYIDEKKKSNNFLLKLSLWCFNALGTRYSLIDNHQTNLLQNYPVEYLTDINTPSKEKTKILKLR